LETALEATVVPSVEELIEKLDTDGYVAMPGAVSPELVSRLQVALEHAMDHAAALHQASGVGGTADSDDNPEGADGPLGGAAHHVVVHGGAFLDLLDTQPCFDTISAYLGSDQIVLNAFGAVSNPKSAGAYEHAKIVHRDTRSFHPSFRQLVWFFVLLDDFTIENGATWMMAGSSDRPDRPSNEEFYESAHQVTAPKGSMVLMDGRTWHAAGMNQTDEPRRLLTLAFSRPFVKPQLDYCRALGTEAVAEMSENLKQVLGYYSRVPASLEEWYTLPENRFYRSNQG